MKLIKKHKNNYKDQSKKVLIRMLDEVYEQRRLNSSKSRYNPSNSKRNNARRAIKDLCSRRQDSITRIRIENHIKILKGLK